MTDHGLETARRFGPLLALWGCLGCGTNRPEIPPELLAEPAACGDGAYPEGPYGSEPGEVVADACFRGWSAPDRTPHSEATLEELSLGAYYDPNGERYELLLVNSAALWCAACLVEHEDLPAYHEELSSQGLVILSALFQDLEGEPAGFQDLKRWVETFETPFPMVLDPAYQLGAYASAETAPLNLLVDARTMRIVEKFLGDQSTVLWPLVREELARRAE